MERSSSGTCRWVGPGGVVSAGNGWCAQGEGPQIQHKVRGQADGIAHLAWSPDDSLLLSCGREDSPEAIVFSTQVRLSLSLSLSLWPDVPPSPSVDRRGEVSCAEFSRRQPHLWGLVSRRTVFLRGWNKGPVSGVCECLTVCVVLLVCHLLSDQALDGSVSSSWEGIRVNALAAHPSPRSVYAADTHSRVRRYNFQDMSYQTL